MWLYCRTTKIKEKLFFNTLILFEHMSHGERGRITFSSEDADFSIVAFLPLLSSPSQ